MKYIKKYENKILDNILDKIYDTGMESLTNLEKEYLNKYSTDKDTSFVKREIKTKNYEGEIGPYKATINILNKDGNKYFAKLIVNDIVYEGYILFDENDNYLTSVFDNETSDVFTDLEGLEHEIDNFCEYAFYKTIEQQ